MRKINDVQPGKTFTVKVPVDADQQTLEFLNKKRDITRNKLVYSILDKEAKKENGKEISIRLSFSLTTVEKEKLLDPMAVKSLEVFVKALIGMEKTKILEVHDEIDMAALDGLINYE
ncbi:hypothetical protein [Bacillus cereus]|uniref:Uncharacterized protein n=1 Tax=Bacillus cereus VD184 TaxID=1053242 RepID=A0A9W5R1Y4_BACCE|nr:hypothetical protein [Bacillus cereus]EOQ04519.1 hypothetical protein IKC_06021 [Bacillus cereus VD184]